MDYDVPNNFPIERHPDAPTSDHFTYANGVSRGRLRGEAYQELRRENQRRVQSAKHLRQSHTS